MDTVAWETLDVDKFRDKIKELFPNESEVVAESASDVISETDVTMDNNETDIGGRFVAWLFSYLCSRPGCESLVKVLLGFESSVVHQHVVAFLHCALQSTFENNLLESMACLLLDFGRSVSGLPQRCLIRLMSSARTFSKKHHIDWPAFHRLSQTMRINVASSTGADPLPDSFSAQKWTLVDLMDHYFESRDDVPDVSVKATSLQAAVKCSSHIQVELHLRDIDTLDQILPIYASVSREGFTLFQACCLHNNPRVFHSLVTKLRNVLSDWCESDLVDRIVANELSRPHPVTGMTCLMLAFQHHSAELFRPLLLKGAAYENSVRCRERGWSAIMYLVEGLGPSSRVFFLSRLLTMMQTIIGADNVSSMLLSDATSIGLSALSNAASIGDEILVDWMASFCVSVGAASDAAACYDTQDSLKHTPLFYACINGHSAVVKLMLQAGASPSMIIRPGVDIMSLLHIQIVWNHRNLSLRGEQREHRQAILYRTIKLLNAAVEEDFRLKKQPVLNTSKHHLLCEDYRQVYFEPFIRADPFPVLSERWQTLGELCCKPEPFSILPEDLIERRKAVEWMARVWTEFGSSSLTHCSCAKDISPYVDSSTETSGGASASFRGADPFKDVMRNECTLPEVFVRASCMYDQVARILCRRQVDFKLCGIASLIWCYLQFHAMDAQEVDVDGKIINRICRLPSLRQEYHIHATSIRQCVYLLVLDRTHPLSVIRPTPIEFISMLVQRQVALLSEKISPDLRHDLDALFGQVLLSSFGFLTYLLLLSPPPSSELGRDGSATAQPLIEDVEDVKPVGDIEDIEDEFDARSCLTCPMSMALFAYNIAVSTVMRLSFTLDFPRLTGVLSHEDLRAAATRSTSDIGSRQLLFLCSEHVILPTSESLDSCVDKIIDLMQTFTVPFVCDLTNLFSPRFTGRVSSS